MAANITKDTFVSLGVVVLIASAIWWASNLDARSRADHEALQAMQPKVDQLLVDMAALRERLGDRVISSR